MQPNKNSTDSSSASVPEAPQPLELSEEKPSPQPIPPKFSPKRVVNWTKKHPRRSALIVIALVGMLLVLPFTRYQILGLVVKKPVSLKFVDSKTGEAISEATVNVRGQVAQTDKDGVAKLSSIPVGQSKVVVDKKYYQSLTFELMVGLGTPGVTEHTLVALGRPVKVEVVNTITKQPLVDAAVAAGDSKGKTNVKGQAQLVVSPDNNEVTAEISLKGFNTTKVILKPNDTSENSNHFSLAPAGKLYFLSKASGKIDVVKSNLDGSERQVVLAGTGQESETDTVLLASRDWKFLALKAKRDTKTNYNALYLIDTQNNDQLITADEGDASFNVHGWIDHYLVYTANRNVVNQPEKYKLKSYNADNSSITLLDTTEYKDFGYGPYKPNGLYTTRTLSQVIENVSLLKNQVVYKKTYQGLQPSDQPAYLDRIITVNSDNKNRLTLYENDVNLVDYYSLQVYKPNEMYITVNFSDSSPDKYYEYEAGASKTKEVSAEEGAKFNDRPYTTYLQSPSGKLTFWSESRDGKEVFLVGNDNGDNGAEIGRLSEHNVYGWYTEDYVLLSKKGSELYITSRSGGEPVKVTDYHKPTYNYIGYGGGYGGL